MQSILIVGSGNYGGYVYEALRHDFNARMIDGFEFDPSNIPEGIVYIATPYFTHYDIARKSLLAKKDVVCEKPLALSLLQVEELFALARDQGHRLGTGLLLRYHPFYVFVKELQNTHGAIRSMKVENKATESNIQSSWYWDRHKSGGWFLTSEIHWYHLFIWLTEAADASVVEAKESEEMGRTIETWSSVDTDTGQTLSVSHVLNSSERELDCRVDIIFDTFHVTIEGWIPESIKASDSGLVMPLPQTKGDKDTAYHELIRENMKALRDENRSDSLIVILSHSLSIDA